MKRIFKIKVLSAIMAFSVLFSSFGMLKNNVTVSADSIVQPIPPYTQDTELFSWDCNNQAAFDARWAFAKYGYLGNLAAINPQNTSVYFEYCQSVLRYASLPLGYKYLYDKMWYRTGDYSWNNAYDSNLQLKPGVTYEVSYNYKNSGTVAYDLTIGLAVGYVTYLDGTDDATCLENFKNIDADGKRYEYYRPDFKCEAEIVSYSKGTVLTQDDWTEQKAYITIPAGTEIGEKDRLYITFNGGGAGTSKTYYYVDDIKVTALAPDYLFKYNTNGGKNGDGSSYTEYSFFTIEGSGVNLPANPVKLGYVFGGWYTDEQLTKAYNPADYEVAQQTYNTVNLYAKWKDASKLLYDVGDFNSQSSPYYGIESLKSGSNDTANTYNSSRWCIPDTVKGIDDGGDGMLKYKYTKSSENKNIVGESTGNYPYVNAPVAIVEDEGNKFILQPNTSYTISFDYFVADTGSEQGSNAQIVLARTQPDADHADVLNVKGAKSYKMSVVKNSSLQNYHRGAILVEALQKSTSWQNISYTFTTLDWDDTTKFAGELSKNWNALSFSGFGYGEIYIDNIKIELAESVSTINEYFQNGMLFQQKKPMTIWGTAASADSNISANLYLNGTKIDTANATVSDDLSWELSFSPRDGGYDKYYITVFEGNTCIGTFSNVLIGELWLASGQSNMQYCVVNDANPDLYKPNENIRIYYFQSPKSGYTKPLPATEQTQTNGTWIIPHNSSAFSYVSAVAYSTCLNLQKELDIPVGFINVAKGATPIETWLSRNSIENNTVIKNGLKLNGRYYTESQLEAYNSDENSNWARMTILYNNLIAPITRTNICGILWYQGESNIYNGNRATLYKAELCELATSYSNTFGFEAGEMPFVFANITPFYYTNISATTISEFSETLSNAVDELEGKVKAMQVPIYDQPLDYQQGNSAIHPNHKFGVGTRFADILIKEHYTENDKSYLAPVYQSMTVSGNRIILTFKNVGDGLAILNNGTKLKGFKISGSDGVFVNADAVIIDSNRVAVWGLGVMEPTAVTYAWDNLCADASLGNSINVPAVAFRTNSNANNKYQLSNEWLDLDKATKWVYSEDAQTGDYLPVWDSSESVSLSFVSGIFNGSAMKVTHLGQNSSFEPILSYPNCKFSLSGTSAVSVVLKNDDKSDKALMLSVVSGGKTYSLKAVGTNQKTHTINAAKVGIYRFSTTELYTSDGTLVTQNTEQILNNITRIYFNISGASGSIMVYDIIISTCDPSEVLMLGDANGDIEINVKDLVRLKKHISGLLKNNNELVMDLNKDSHINSLDLTSLRYFLLR